MVLRKPEKFFKMNLEKQKKKKTDEYLQIIVTIQGLYI